MTDHEKSIIHAIRMLNRAMSVAWTTARSAAGDNDAAFGRALQAGNRAAWNLFSPAAIAAVEASGRHLPTGPQSTWLDAKDGLEADIVWLAKLAHSYGR